MNRIMLIEKPWVSKDGKILVGGHPLSTISFNTRHANDLRQLVDKGHLTLDPNNEELCRTLLERRICRPILDVPKQDVRTISTQIFLYFHVTNDINAAQKSLTKLLNEKSPFSLTQLVFSAESIETWRNFVKLMHESSIELPLELPEPKSAFLSRSEEYFVAFFRPVEISALQVKLLLLELTESESDLITTRIIGNSASLGSNYISTMISHFEEHNFILDKGDKWATYNSNDWRLDADLPFIAGKTRIFTDAHTFDTAQNGISSLAKPMLASMKIQPLSLIYEPDIIARDCDPLTLGGFVRRSIEHGKKLGLHYTVENREEAAKLRGSSLMNFISTLILGKFGLALSALTSALQIAYLSQKLVSQPYGDLAAVQFVYKSHVYTFEELNNKLRKSIALPIALLMPFSKIARRIGIGIALLRIVQVSKSSDKAEIPTNLLLACMQDTCVSCGLWMAAASRKSVSAVLPNVKFTKWHANSKFPSRKMESPQPTS